MEPVKKNEYTIEQINEIFESTFNLNRNGLKEMALSRFKQEVEQAGADPNVIYKKYKAHIELCKPYQNAGMTKKEYTIRELYDFVNLAMYKREFSSVTSGNPDRDHYLYGI